MLCIESMIRNILKQLGKTEPFLCEKRVVYEIATAFSKLNFPFILEYPAETDINKKAYEDIRFETPNGVFIVEVKYCPSDIRVQRGKYLLTHTRNNSSSKRIEQFLSDIKRTQKTIEIDKNVKGGFCIFITNQNNFINSEKLRNRLKEMFERTFSWETLDQDSKLKFLLVSIGSM